MRVSSLNKLFTLASVLALGLAGCGPQYEIDRPGTWQPTGVNDRNLRAMIADPRDLGYGIASTTDRGNGASRAVTRLLTDHRRPLLNASLSKVSSSDTGDTSGGGGVGGTGGSSSGGTSASGQ